MTVLQQLKLIEKVSSRILGKKSVKVKIVDFADKSDLVGAVFVPEENIIYINYLNAEISYKTFVAVSHESRHSYQYQVIKGLIPAKPTDNIELWKHEFDHAIVPKNITDEETKPYALRGVEVDAIAYSELFLKAINPKKKLKLPDWLRIEVDKQKEILSKAYNFNVLLINEIL